MCRIGFLLSHGLDLCSGECRFVVVDSIAVFKRTLEILADFVVHDCQHHVCTSQGTGGIVFFAMSQFSNFFVFSSFLFFRQIPAM